MKDLIARARVSTVYPDDGTAKVIQEDNETVSAELTIIRRNDDWLPEVGDYVICLYLPNGSKSGYIVGEA